MAENVAARGPVHDSPHVMAATNVDRGDTPAQWNAVDSPSVTGAWKDINQGSGPADREGNTTGDFESSGRWKQT